MMGGTPTQRAGLYLLIWCVIIMGVITTMMALRETDGRWFPVVAEFHVDEAIDHDDGILISGTMTKGRSCVFRELVTYVRYDDTEQFHFVPVTFDRTSAVSRSAIEQAWGPWVLHVSEAHKAADIKMYIRHSCHSLWDTSGKLAAFTLRQEDGSITIRNLQ